jgi:GNAT superfamily N-acetyltransferase
MPKQRSATLADMGPMWAIRTAAVRATCASHYPPEVIDTLCATAPPASMPDLIRTGATVVAEADGRLLGYAALDIGKGEVDAVFVEPGQQGRGIARALLAALEAIAVQHGIDRLYLSSSLNAVPFYERARGLPPCATRSTRTAAGSASRPSSWKSSWTVLPAGDLPADAGRVRTALAAAATTSLRPRIRSLPLKNNPFRGIDAFPVAAPAPFAFFSAVPHRRRPKYCRRNLQCKKDKELTVA